MKSSNQVKSLDIVPKDQDNVPLWSFSSFRFYIGIAYLNRFRTIVNSIYKFILAFLLFYVLFCGINMRTNIGMAMVCMVNSTAYSTKIDENNLNLTGAEENINCKRKQSIENFVDEGYNVNIEIP